MKTFAFGAFALAMLAGSAAAAQDQNFGPVVPGVCVYHHDRLLAQSTAGQSLVTGLQRLQQEVQAELAPYEQFIQTESQALQQGQATIPQDQFQQRGRDLEARYREFETLRQTRTGELRYTLAYQQSRSVRRRIRSWRRSMPSAAAASCSAPMRCCAPIRRWTSPKRRSSA